MLQFIDSIHRVNARQWNSVLPNDYPFVRHEFLAALEDSGSTSAEQGWKPRHLLVWQDDILRAALPLFLKDHSYGEYVFDWGWANAYAQHGYDYYPKLVNAVPFTPCRGPRLLTQDIDPTLVNQVAGGLTEECTRLGASGWHCLFPEASLSDALTDLGAPQRLGCQFHWFNDHYRTFEDFVGGMSSRKRKNILKERRQVAAQGLQFEFKEGPEITAGDWDLFYGLYHLTYLKHTGQGGYLEHSFFQQLGQTLPEHCLMVCAQKAGQTIAAALFLHDSTTLYGRYWGCRAEFEFLHFETCYYRGIDYAIEHGLKRFDGGAQGEHKVARGFQPVTTFSNHWLAEPVFRQPIKRVLELEAAEVQAYIEAARNHLPFKRPG